MHNLIESTELYPKNDSITFNDTLIDVNDEEIEKLTMIIAPKIISGKFIFKL